MQPRDVDVCIVGGGVAGLAAACAFRKAGRSVLLLERREQTLSGDPHRGDLLAFGVPAKLAEWGIDLELREAYRVRHGRVESPSKLLASVEVPDTSPAWSLPHAQVEEALLDAALSLGAEVFMGWQLQASYRDESGRLRRLTAVSLRDGVEVRAKLVVGADGRSSRIREAIGLKRRDVVAAGHDVMMFEATLPQGPSERPNDAWIVRVGTSGGASVVPIGSDRVRVAVPARRGDGLLLAALDGPELLLAVQDRIPLGPGATVDPRRCRSYDLTDSFHLTNYVDQGAVVIGDAAHVAPPPSPFGMQMAIEDAAALGSIVGPAIGGSDKALEKALQSYELVRWQSNDARLRAARAWVDWLLPLPAMRATVLKTPFARSAVRDLVGLG